jgi:hypothetical protein
MLRRLTVAVLAAAALLAGALPAAAEPYGEDPESSYDEAADRLAQVEVRSFTASPRSVLEGGSTTLAWYVDAPSGVKIRLDGIDVGRRDSKVIEPRTRDERHFLSASTLGATVQLRAITVGIDPCPYGPWTTTDPQCSRTGTARIDYAMPTRWDPNIYRDGTDSFSSSTIQRVLDPPSRGVTLDACATDPGAHGRIERYAWTLTQPMPNRLPGASYELVSDWCEARLAVPQLGAYRVSLVAHSPQGTTLSASTTIHLRDLLVVSLGDSMASGEGNPDVKGDYLFPEGGIRTEATWMDQGCHRSRRGAPPRAAEKLETADPRATVSFISLACTGAEITHLTRTRQSDVNGQLRPPQLDAMQALLCRVDCNRPVDVLYLSIGINDLNFSGILEACVLRDPNLDDTATCDSKLNRAANLAEFDPATNVRRIVDRLLDIRTRIAELGLTVRKVVINEYPVNIFTDGSGDPRPGCGALPLSLDTTTRLLRIGQDLNRQIEYMATNSARWAYASGVVSAFRGHGYCAGDDTWFRGFTASLDTQGDERGTAHPNGTGHSAIGQRLANRYMETAPPPSSSDSGPTSYEDQQVCCG